MDLTTIKHIQKKALIKISDKIKRQEKIKVAFYVPFSSTFASEPLYKLMLEDEMFEPRIIIIPVVNRGDDYIFSNLNETYNDVAKKYKKVINSYSKSQQAFVDLVSSFDLVITTNPYDALTHEYYRYATATKRGVLCVYVPYGPYISRVYALTLADNNFTFFYKVFFEQEHTIRDYSKISPTRGENAMVFGSAKMDGLALLQRTKQQRKRVIIASHHSVQAFKNYALSLSTFLKYHEFYFELAKLYREIDFIIRPHPLLFVTLINEKLWTKEEIENYINRIEAEPNMTYQGGGDCYETFINSDALIHDCGSFTIEYLFTGQPVCYMLNDYNTSKSMNIFALECLSQHYLAENKEKIINFIENVVILGNDVMKEQRQSFFEKNLKYNYPNVSKDILNHIKAELKNG